MAPETSNYECATEIRESVDALTVEAKRIANALEKLVGAVSPDYKDCPSLLRIRILPKA